MGVLEPLLWLFVGFGGGYLLGCYVGWSNSRYATPARLEEGYQPKRPDGPEVDLLAHPPESDEVSIQPAPPARIFYAKTRYVHCGRGKPLPFELDEQW